MSMIDQPSPTCTCSAFGRCDIETSHHCFVCGAALCECCADAAFYEGATVFVCGCGEELCHYALERRMAEKRNVRL
mgnify:CR=1 FL=1